MTSCLAYKDLDLLSLTDAARPRLVAIDAPLSLPRGLTSVYDHRGEGALREAERVLLENQAVMPLYHYVTVYLKDPELNGWSGNLLDWHPVKYLSFGTKD